jgi:hypothetical protein
VGQGLPGLGRHCGNSRAFAVAQCRQPLALHSYENSAYACAGNDSRLIPDQTQLVSPLPHCTCWKFHTDSLGWHEQAGKIRAQYAGLFFPNTETGPGRGRKQIGPNASPGSRQRQTAERQLLIPNLPHGTDVHDHGQLVQRNSPGVQESSRQPSP